MVLVDPKGSERLLVTSSNFDWLRIWKTPDSSDDLECLSQIGLGDNSNRHYLKWPSSAGVFDALESNGLIQFSPFWYSSSFLHFSSSHITSHISNTFHTLPNLVDAGTGFGVIFTSSSPPIRNLAFALAFLFYCFTLAFRFGISLWH